MAKREIREVGDDEDDDLAYDDLLTEDTGIPPAVLLMLQGHHVAALGWLSRSRAGAAAVAIANAVTNRLRTRKGGWIARALAAEQPGSPGYADRLRAIADELRARASRFALSALEPVIGDDAAKRLRADTAAWLVGGELPADELSRLAEHVAAGGEVWGGLGDGRAFSRNAILKSSCDPSAEPALELAVDAVPPLRGIAFAARVSYRTDPDTMLGTRTTLRLVRGGMLMICHHTREPNVKIDESTGTVTLELEAAR